MDTKSLHYAILLLINNPTIIWKKYKKGGVDMPIYVIKLLSVFSIHVQVPE